MHTHDIVTAMYIYLTSSSGYAKMVHGLEDNIHNVTNVCKKFHTRPVACLTSEQRNSLILDLSTFLPSACLL